MRSMLHVARKVAGGFTSGLPRQTSASASAVKLQDARPFEEIPGPKGKYNLPFIGPMLHFKPFGNHTSDDMPKFFAEILDKYGSLVRIYLGEWVVLVSDPSDIEIVFRSEGTYPRRVGFLLNVLFSEKYGIPKSIGDMQGEEWHNFRTPINPVMMRTKSAQHYLPIQNEVADDLLRELAKPLAAKELSDLFYRYSCESISAVCFNKRLGYLDADIDPEKLQTLDDISVILLEVSEALKVPPFLLKYFPLKMKKRYFESGLRVHNKSMEYYKNAVDEIKQKDRDGTLDVDKHDFMLSLMTSEKMTPENMASIAFSLFVAGTDSTARTLQMVLYNLAKNPDKQEKLYQEIHSTMGSSGPLTQQALSQMTYLQVSLKESYRVTYPISSGTQRYLPDDIVLQGYRIPAGTSILMMNQRLVKDSKYFTNPESFIPERWLRNETGKRSQDIPASILKPFGFGKRMCIGKRFAEQEICLAVTKILQKFRVSVPPDQKPPELSYTPFTGPKEPMNFVFERRN